VQIRKKLEDAKSAGNQTLFLFYYSGHGDNEALEIGSERSAPARSCALPRAA
jgi:hypothetical protein